MGRFSLQLILFDCLLYNGDQKGRKYAEGTNNFPIGEKDDGETTKKNTKMAFPAAAANSQNVRLD
jgi:hypothetical protein